MSKRIYVGNLSYQTTSYELADLFKWADLLNDKGEVGPANTIIIDIGGGRSLCKESRGTPITAQPVPSTSASNMSCKITMPGAHSLESTSGAKGGSAGRSVLGQLVRVYGIRGAARSSYLDMVSRIRRAQGWVTLGGPVTSCAVPPQCLTPRPLADGSCRAEKLA